MQPRFRSAVALLLAGIFVGVCVEAQTPVPAAKDRKIRQLIRLTGAADLGQQVVRQMIPALKQAFPGESEAFWNEFQAQIKPSDFVEMVVPVYAKHFSEQDLDGLTAFYSTPLGQKVIREMPATMSECMTAGQEWGRRLGEKVAAKIQKQKGH
jgi:hypothetical protein